ncbi:hypothetical protein SAMN05446927_2760 [Caballeronia arationis]|jgi:hypothetical protein|uniref:Uncharacterized protein n=1 Tax=Caballeronia arationis TaxID=1777142 RepID=A0A7Z7I5E2_9BURK|nr:hypothetical protein SAMN05446927_2760 [Caballeronia arationis]
MNTPKHIQFQRSAGQAVDGNNILYTWEQNTQAAMQKRRRAIPRTTPFIDLKLRQLYFDVGIANSAPFSVLSGQRCMIDFCFV